MSSPQVDWFSQNAPADPIQAAMGRKPVPHSDWFAANHPATGPNDPNGNYDFTSVGLGKVTGARMNGHVATRQEAFEQQTNLHGIAQNFANTVQQHQQAMEDFRQSFTTDQMTKDLLGDLAGMAVAGGASKLAGLGRWTAVAPQVEKSAVGDWFADHAPGIGPGTAHVTDPAFEGQKFARHAAHLNDLDQHEITGNDVAYFNDLLGLAKKQILHPDPEDPFGMEELMQTMGTGNKKAPLIDLLYKYDTDPEFHRLADASRHYVHNNSAMTEASRRALGMEPLPGNSWVHNPADDTYTFDLGTVMLNGQKFDPEGVLKGELANYHLKGNTSVPWEDARKFAEDLHTGIREAPLTDRTLYRGLAAYKGNSYMAPTNEAEAAYNTFYGLKPGDKLDLPLSSFSTSEKEATKFAGTQQPIILVLEGPSKHLNMRPFSTYSEKEFVTQGGFKVTRIRDETVPSPYHENPLIDVRYIHLKQTSVF